MINADKKTTDGFTIVELLVVIVVIGILASVSVVSYSGVQERARSAKISDDLSIFRKAIDLARHATGKTLLQVTGSGYSAGNCVSKANGTDLANLPKSDSCWTSYLNVLNTVSAASGVDIRNIVDPWGRPYRIDENEGESGGCGLDSIRVYSYPFVNNVTYPGFGLSVPLSGYTGCS